ncbi:hypothetical protein B0H11DRAFT_2370648, partial [Mycena galericulata]
LYPSLSVLPLPPFCFCRDSSSLLPLRPRLPRLLSSHPLAFRPLPFFIVVLVPFPFYHPSLPPPPLSRHPPTAPLLPLTPFSYRQPRPPLSLASPPFSIPIPIPIPIHSLLPPRPIPFTSSSHALPHLSPSSRVPSPRILTPFPLPTRIILYSHTPPPKHIYSYHPRSPISSPFLLPPPILPRTFFVPRLLLLRICPPSLSWPDTVPCVPVRPSPPLCTRHVYSPLHPHLPSSSSLLPLPLL